jgi:RNA polymerase sigma-70 factor, ECF subfamily
MTDEEMAKAMARGDQAALLEFVRLYHDGLFRYMRSLVATREDAEDLAVEAITRAHLKIGSYRGNSSLKTWVHRIGYHQFTHWKRRQRPTESVHDTLLAPARPFESVNEADALQSSLIQLPETLRQPFVLHEINELSLEEISVILELPVGTVKSRLHYARAKLRELLTPQKEETHVSFVYEPRRAH